MFIRLTIYVRLSLPTLIFYADPKVCIAIFRQNVKSDLFFYIKKSDKIKKKSLPTDTLVFSNESRNTTLFFLGLT